MSGKQETSAAIIAEMRGARTEFPFVYLMGEPDTPEVIDYSTKEIIEPRKINIRRVTVKELADRLEAALGREREASGNAAAMRDALANLVDVIDRCDSGSPLWWHCGAKGVKPLKDAKAALAKPPRNCDVGTTEQEQVVRFNAFCKEDCDRCSACPKATRYGIETPCYLIWAQMPYEEGGAK